MSALLAISLLFNGSHVRYRCIDKSDSNGSYWFDGNRYNRSKMLTKTIRFSSDIFTTPNYLVDSLYDFRTKSYIFPNQYEYDVLKEENSIDNSSTNRPKNIPLYILFAIVQSVAFILLFYFLFTLNENNMFGRRNNWILNSIGFSYLFLFVCNLIIFFVHLAMITSLTRHDFEGVVYSPSLTNLSIALFFFLLARAFYQGQEMKKDQEYMV